MLRRSERYIADGGQRINNDTFVNKYQMPHDKDTYNMAEGIQSKYKCQG